MASALTYIAIVSTVLIIFGIPVYLLRRKVKKLKAIKTQIPEDVINDFNEVERIFKESEGKINPQEALWIIYKKKVNERRLSNNGKIHQGRQQANKDRRGNGRGRRRGRPRGSGGRTESEEIKDYLQHKGNFKRNNGTVTAAKQGTIWANLYPESGREQDVQALPSSRIGEDERDIQEGRTNPKRKFRFKLRN